MATLNMLKRMTARSKMRVGRGGKRGKTSGRGTKGQNARSGRKKRPEMRDIIKKIPKRRGFGKNRGRTVNSTRAASVTVSIERLDQLFDSGADVTLESLVEHGAVRVRRKAASIKIVGGGELTKKLSLKGITVSGSARAAIVKAGGSVQ